MTQKNLFDAPMIDMTAPPTLAPRQAAVTVTSNASVPKKAERRVSGQRAAILTLLRRGKCTVTELKTLASQYNARLFELREAGYVITNEHDQESGESTYQLVSEPKTIARGVVVKPKRSKRAYRRRR